MCDFRQARNLLNLFFYVQKKEIKILHKMVVFWKLNSLNYKEYLTQNLVTYNYSTYDSSLALDNVKKFWSHHLNFLG